MPLTGFQRGLLAVLAVDAPEGRYLAGGAAIHFTPNSTRFSDDLDFFHDSEVQVANAFAADRERLKRAGWSREWPTPESRGSAPRSRVTGPSHQSGSSTGRQ